MNEDGGLLEITIFVVVILGIVCLLSNKEQRDPFLQDLENWLKSSRDRRLKGYLEVHIERHFPDFKEWKKQNKKK
ncbi:MAG: hypothetical protein D3909_00905 [Candidatus Electrothrix sp. ATG1]|nr:hypothetical protein [Candidatus Electrothrix sp. ATG1]MCI5210317.1 hypothetical protein [Candidatus Electrothrix sp. ATG2]